MKPGRQKRRRWRFIRRLVFVFLLGLMALWGTVNLFFSISWGTELIAGRVEKRLGLPCDLESVTWTPWGGLVVQDFVVKSGESSGFHGEILRIDTMSVDLSWISLIQRKKRFERLEIKGVRGEVSIELLRSLLKKNAVSVAQDSEPVEVDAAKPAETVPSETAPKENGEERESISRKEKEKDRPDLPLKPVDDFEGLVVLRDVNLALTSLEHPGLSAAVEDLEGEIPVWGAERDGYLAFTALHAGGGIVNGEEEIPLEWKGQFIKVDQHPLKVIGLDMKISLAVRVSPGLPVGLQVVVPKQQVDFSPLFGARKSPVSIDQLIFKGGLQGYLTMPQSFSGYGSAGFSGLKILDERDASAIEFYRGYGEARVNRAGLLVPDARMIGDEEAVLLNGFVTSNGEVAATVRVVGSPERAEAYEKRVRQTNEDWSLDFKPLVTEDRLYRDLHMESSEGGLTVDLGGKRKPVSLFPALQAILTGQHPPANRLQ